VSLQHTNITEPDSSGNTVTEQETLWI
jgi:hypothetical protein